MSSEFGDNDAALRMRTIIDKRADARINLLRPDIRVGKIYSYDEGSGIAKVLLPGATVDDLISVYFAVDKIPSKAMVDTFATEGYAAEANVVRVGGRPGAFFILDYAQGAPRSNVTLPPGPINFNGEKGINADDPTAPQDVATKNYVDTTVDEKLETTSSKSFTFAAAQTEWVLDHNFGMSPVDVTITDLAGKQIMGSVTHPSNNRAVVTFYYPNAGTARVRR